MTRSTSPSEESAEPESDSARRDDPFAGPYRAWLRERAQVTVPAGFADRVLELCRDRSAIEVHRAVRRTAPWLALCCACAAAGLFLLQSFALLSLLIAS